MRETLCPSYTIHVLKLRTPVYITEKISDHLLADIITKKILSSNEDILVQNV